MITNLMRLPSIKTTLSVAILAAVMSLLLLAGCAVDKLRLSIDHGVTGKSPTGDFSDPAVDHSTP